MSKHRAPWLFASRPNLLAMILKRYSGPGNKCSSAEPTDAEKAATIKLLSAHRQTYEHDRESAKLLLSTGLAPQPKTLTQWSWLRGRTWPAYCSTFTKPLRVVECNPHASNNSPYAANRYQTPSFPWPNGSRFGNSRAGFAVGWRFAGRHGPRR